MKNSLEKSKFFPVLAWASIVGFAYVTYTYTLELVATVTQTASIVGS